MITNERRAFKRVNKKFAITYKPHNSPGSVRGTSFTKNISAGGVYFTSIEGFDIGQMLECIIKMPKVAKESKWIGRVVRCEDIKGHVVKTYGIALEFAKSFGNADKDLRKALEENGS
ncbi:MAG: PilZ domain-containing protein [Candidatus Omnitrophota bacterium]